MIRSPQATSSPSSTCAPPSIINASGTTSADEVKITFHDSNEIPTVVADSSDDPDYEIVKVPYPFFTPDGRKARFFRVKVTLIP